MKNEEKNGLPEIYRHYKNRFSKDERTSEAFIDYKTFGSIIKDFNKEVSRLIIEEGVEFKMPLRLGSIRIRKYKRKIRFNEDGSVDKSRLAVNWPPTKELWAKEYPGLSKAELKEIKNKPLVYHLNEHSDGYSFLFYWNKKGSNAVNRSIFSMVFTFTNDRHLAEIIKSDIKKVEYYE